MRPKRGDFFMHRWLCLWAVVGSSAVHASWPTDVQGSCSGTLTETWGDSITLSCTGDLALSGLTPQARLEAVDSITLSADGSLTIDNLTLRALNVSLWGGQSFTMSDTSHLEHAGSVVWVPGHVTITPLTPVFLNLTPAVPEPTTWALMLAGALVVAGCRRR